MKYYLNPCTNAWRNMAFDEWCLMHGPAEPVFYLWRNAPSVIVGYNQDVYREVNLPFLQAKGILLARRVTGGGAVYHDLQNLNYSFVGPLGTVHPQLFVDALSRLGLKAELTGRNDIFLDGRKISGYARRMWQNRELVHGTLMYNVDIQTLTEVPDVPGESKLAKKGVASIHSRVANIKDYLPQFSSLDAIQTQLQSILAAGDNLLQLTPNQQAEIDALSAQKFSTDQWLYNRF